MVLGETEILVRFPMKHFSTLLLDSHGLAVLKLGGKDDHILKGVLGGLRYCLGNHNRACRDRDGTILSV